MRNQHPRHRWIFALTGLMSLSWFAVDGHTAPTTQPKAAHQHHKHHQHDKHHKHHKHDKRIKYKHHGMQHHFHDVKHWVKVFDNPARTKWQKPQKVIEQMQIKAGMKVVDIGAGTGYFLPYLRSAVGKTGRVAALDVSAPLVGHMKKRIKKAGWQNVNARLVTPEKTGLAKASVDRILIVNTWHHIAHRKRYAQQLKTALRPGGKLVIVDFTMQAKRGPGKKHRIPAQIVQQTLRKAGFTTTISQKALPEQYIVIGHK